MSDDRHRGKPITVGGIDEMIESPAQSTLDRLMLCDQRGNLKEQRKKEGKERKARVSTVLVVVNVQPHEQRASPRICTP